MSDEPGPRLVLPDVRCRRSFVRAMEEFVAEGRVGDDTMVGTDLLTWRDRWGTEEGFAEFVRATRAREHTPAKAGHVTDTSLWWVEGQHDEPTYLGRIAIRHTLTDRLREIGGHIGYDVRPSRRREGHATAMLRAALPLAHERGIDPVLITCDHDNVGSRRVIEACGGVLEDRRGDKLRYWVPSSRPSRSTES